MTSACDPRFVSFPHVSHYNKDPVLDRNLAISGINCLTVQAFIQLLTAVDIQALFDVFLFVLTIFNAASRPRRANVKIITDLRRDGCVFYLVRANGRLSAQLRSSSRRVFLVGLLLVYSTIANLIPCTLL